MAFPSGPFLDSPRGVAICPIRAKSPRRDDHGSLGRCEASWVRWESASSRIAGEKRAAQQPHDKAIWGLGQLTGHDSREGFEGLEGPLRSLSRAASFGIADCRHRAVALRSTGWNLELLAGEKMGRGGIRRGASSVHSVHWLTAAKAMS